MKLFTELRILDRNFAIFTNSPILFDIIEREYSNSIKTKNINFSSAIPCILKHPYDVKEVLFIIWKFINKALGDLQERYWIFHASAFCKGGKTTVLLGNSGSGKSSIVFAMALLYRYKILGDDRILVNKKSFEVLPFHNGLKLNKVVLQKFTKWFLNSKANLGFHGYANERLLYRKDLNNLNIQFAEQKKYLENIIFLEEKQNASLIHLYNHCFNKMTSIDGCLRSLNKFIYKKNIKFIPPLTGYLKSRRKICEYLKKIT